MAPFGYSDSPQMRLAIPALSPHGDDDPWVFGLPVWARAQDTKKSGVCHQAGLVMLGGREVPV